MTRVGGWGGGPTIFCCKSQRRRRSRRSEKKKPKEIHNEDSVRKVVGATWRFARLHLLSQPTSPDPPHTTPLPRSSSPHPTVLYIFIIIITADVVVVVAALRDRRYTHVHKQQLSPERGRFALVRARAYER